MVLALAAIFSTAAALVARGPAGSSGRICRRFEGLQSDNPVHDQSPPFVPVTCSQQQFLPLQLLLLHEVQLAAAVVFAAGLRVCRARTRFIVTPLSDTLVSDDRGDSTLAPLFEP